jgi:glutamine---fructose-6-phosphate transaminase (isomerizing)
MEAWHDSTYPELRSGPPWVMEDMVDAEPALALAIAESAPEAAAVATAIRRAHERGEPIGVTGCGTSEHGAEGIAALVTDALGAPAAVARQALDAAADPLPGVCIGVSHEGETAATLAALAGARSAGATTVLVTAAPASRGAAFADEVLPTPLLDRSWCHTVGYVSPLLAGGMIAAALRRDLYDGPGTERLVGRLRALQVNASPVAHVERLLVAGADADAITARELALKVAEGARLATVALSLENVLHGHLVGHDAASALVVVATGSAEATASRRAAQVLAAASRIGMATAAIASPGVADTLEADLKVEVAAEADVPALLGRLLAGAIGLQLFTIALVHERGVNPDLLRREEAPYREAAAISAKRTAEAFDPAA